MYEKLLLLFTKTKAYLRRDERLLLHVTLVLVSGFALLTLFVLLLPPSFLDIEFSEEIQEHHNPWLDFLMKGISIFGDKIVAPVTVSLIAALFFIRNRRRESVFILSTLLSAGLAYVIKVAVNRPRPTGNLVRIIEKADFQSFPSGHVLFYTAFFGLLVFLMYRSTDFPIRLRWFGGLFSLVLIFCIPFSRVYLGAHWFTDVAGGFLLGLLYLIGTVWLFLRMPFQQAKYRNVT